MNEKEILEEAMCIIGEFSHEENADTPTGYKIVSTYSSLVDEIKKFMYEVGFYDED